MIEIQENPDNVPGAVTSGYQRQNERLYTIQTGIDTTEPFDDGNGIITIPAGGIFEVRSILDNAGIIEINGAIFKITADIQLNKPDKNRAYWVAITDNGDGTASWNLVNNPGKWDSGKQGNYTADNTRTLNWVSSGLLLSPPQNTPTVFARENKGKYKTRLPKGWYCAELASGKGLGHGSDGANPDPAGNTDAIGGYGGIANTSNIILFPFWHNGTDEINISLGGDGGNGGKGGNGAQGRNGGYTGGGGGGGGSGGGEESTLSVGNSHITTENINGGNGGNGGNGDSRAGGGGGGGGGLIGGSGGASGNKVGNLGSEPGIGGNGGSSQKGLNINGTNGQNANGVYNTTAIVGGAGGGGGGSNFLSVVSEIIKSIKGNKGISAKTGSGNGSGGDGSEGGYINANNINNDSARLNGNDGKNASAWYYTGGGGGGGGGQGADGKWRRDGEAGGYVKIYKMTA